MKLKTFYIFLLFVIAILYSCEDDPLLDPQNSSSGGGGSYGRVTPVDTGKVNTKLYSQENPALF